MMTGLVAVTVLSVITGRSNKIFIFSFSLVVTCDDVYSYHLFACVWHLKWWHNVKYRVFHTWFRSMYSASASLGQPHFFAFYLMLPPLPQEWQVFINAKFIHVLLQLPCRLFLQIFPISSLIVCDILAGIFSAGRLSGSL